MRQTKTKFRGGATAPSQPMWQRVLAALCLLLVGFASSAQAVHTHGEMLPHQQVLVGTQADAAPALGNEASCPLCLAMHSAMVAEQPAAVTHAVAEQKFRLAEFVERAPDSQWHYAGFSRPPPVVELI